MNGLIKSIIKANKNLKNSLNSKNWELIGSDINSLQQLIDDLEKKQGKDEIEEKNLEKNWQKIYFLLYYETEKKEG